MKQRHVRAVLALLLVAASAVACNEQEPTTPTSPTPPAPITRTFSGTVTRNGAATHPFATQASGTVTATLTALSAPEGTRVGLALGTFSNSACQLVITRDDAIAPTTITGSVSAGSVGAVDNLCVRIYDVGGLTGPADYEIQVSHP
jgi:hypothetical protein